MTKWKDNSKMLHSNVLFSVASSECPIPQRIKELNIDGAWFDSKEENVKLIVSKTSAEIVQK